MGNGFSRRGFLKGLAVAAGAAAGTRIPGAGFIGEAQAATEPTSVVLIHFVGGYNAIFASAAQLQGTFGVTAGNHTVLGNGLSVDNTFANSMSTFAKTHMAAVGVRHGISSHGAARSSLWSTGGQNSGLILANAIGGNASIKAAVVGGNLIGDAPRAAVGGTSFQSINDMQSTIDALGGGEPDPRMPDRGITLSGMTNAEKMSANALAGSPESLDSLANGYKAAVGTLKQPVQVFNPAELRQAYGLGNSTAVRTFASKLAAAELMARAGANVVSMFDGGWDTHGDRNGTTVRNKMTSYVLAPLNTFITRMVQDPSRNVVVVMLGDFSRSLPGSDHQPNLTATVIGKYVKQGTTGRVSNRVALPAGTPSTQGLWSYLSAITKSPAAAFGNNQHPTLAL